MLDFSVPISKPSSRTAKCYPATTLAVATSGRLRASAGAKTVHRWLLPRRATAQGGPVCHVPVLGACPGALMTGTVANWLTTSETSAAIDVSPT